MHKIIDVDLVTRRLRVDKESGRLIWKAREVITPYHKTWNSKYPGMLADKKTDRKGYRMVMIDGCYFRAHRLVWAICNNKDPGEFDIDHANMNKSDNRPDNLRLATSSQNKMNTTIRRDNSSGYKGVSWFAREKKFVAQIWKDKKKTVIGYFDSAEMASRAYDDYSRQLHGEFGRLK